MQFKAGIGCQNPLFCDILSMILAGLFIGLILWFVVFLILNHLKDNQPQKRRKKKAIKKHKENIKKY